MLIPIDEVVHFDFCTHHPSTAAVTDADSTPTFDVYEEATDTGLFGATNATKRTSLTGNYRGTFTASAANGFEAGKWYNVIASATVNSIAGKARVMHFRVAPAEAIAGQPKIDVAAWLGTAAATPTVAGVPEVDLTHIAGSTTDVSTIAASIAAILVDTGTTLDGKIDAIGIDVDALVTDAAAILVDTSTTLDDLVDDLETRLTAALAVALQAHALGIGRGVCDAGSTTTAVVFELVNGAAASATNDFYNGRSIVFTSGALTLQATSITDYVGATKTATVPALTAAPADDVTFIIV